MAESTARPALIVVSGPPGLARRRSRTRSRAESAARGLPRRDQGGDGARVAGFTPGEGDELTERALLVFFGVLRLLLEAGVTTVAEAAFQDRVWRPRLEPFLARPAQGRALRRGPRVAFERIVGAAGRRRAPGAPRSGPGRQRSLRGAAARFDRLRLDIPSIEVATTSATGRASRRSRVRRRGVIAISSCPDAAASVAQEAGLRRLTSGLGASRFPRAALPQAGSSRSPPASRPAPAGHRAAAPACSASVPSQSH